MKTDSAPGAESGIRALRSLALEIARCPVVGWALDGDPRGAECRAIVNWQRQPREQRWPPEPWSGHLGAAKILFISSNPSSGAPDEPVQPGDVLASSPDELILNTFDRAFEPGPWPGIVDADHLRKPFGTRGAWVSYWGWAKRVADEVLGAAKPGDDYAMTEIVHCGSQHEVGVRDAVGTCVPRYLERVLALSPAHVLIFVGATVRNAMNRVYGIPGADLSRWATTTARIRGRDQIVGYYSRNQVIGDRERAVVFRPHPNARGAPRGLVPYLGVKAIEELAQIRAMVAGRQ